MCIRDRVMAARGETKKLETRKRRVPIMTNDTYKGRINTVSYTHLDVYKRQVWWT